MTQPALALTSTPRLRLLTTMQDDQDTRESARERETLPPEAHDTIRPERMPSDFKEVAANDVIAGQRQLQESLDQLLGPGGRLERQTAAIAAVVDAAATRQMQSYDLLRNDMLRRFGLVDARDKDQDARLDAVSNELATLRQQVADMQRSPLGNVYDKTLNGINGALTNIQLQLDAFTATPKSDDTRELTGKTVVVVDNESALAATISRMLRGRGANVVVAHSFAELRSLELGKPDCVLLDLLLGPDDGLEVAAWLSKERGIARSRIILMTGQVGLTNRSGLALIEKPFSLPEVIEEILSSLQN